MNTNKHDILRLYQARETKRSARSLELYPDTEYDRTRRLLISMILSGQSLSDPFVKFSLRSIRDEVFDGTILLFFF